MEREIKFRGLRKHAQKSFDKSYWIYGYYNFEPKSDIAEIIFNNGGISVHNKTVGQFTGLKDKYGVEIYEGDILAYERTKDFKKELVHPFEMSWDDKNSAWTNYSSKDKYVVIGNVHENRELLK